jgi:hypothetical protein
MSSTTQSIPIIRTAGQPNSSNSNNNTHQNITQKQKNIRKQSPKIQKNITILPAAVDGKTKNIKNFHHLMIKNNIMDISPLPNSPTKHSRRN